MSDQMTVEIGQTVPIDLPDASDGTPHTTPVMTCPWPVQIVLPADISPSHEQALMQASANGSIRRLMCMQGHQRRLVSKADPSRMAWLPVMQVSLYVRGPSGPLHRPLHWIATANVLGDGEPHQTLLMHVMQQLADSPGKGVPVRLLVTGRDRRLLLIANLALHNDAAIVWAKALHLAVSGYSLRQDDFAEQWATAKADLLPCVERAGCMRPLMPVAISGRHRTVRGGKLMAWLVTRGWLHPQQVPCEEGGQA